MLGTLSGLLGLIYLTAVFRLRFSQLYRQERGWQGSKGQILDRGLGSYRTDTKSHGHTQGSGPGENLPELLVLQAKIGVLFLPRGPVIPGRLPGLLNCFETAKL